MPQPPRYDLDAELARMVELSTAAAEAAEATVRAAEVAVKAVKSREPDAARGCDALQDVRWWAFLDHGNRACHLGPFLSVQGLTAEVLAASRLGWRLVRCEPMGHPFLPPWPNLAAQKDVRVEKEPVE